MSVGIQGRQSAVSSVGNSSLVAGDSFFSTKISTAPKQDGVQLDFLSFLEALQANQVDVLAITWQQALDSLGTGATAEVRQSLVNLQTSFAFKRPMFRHSAFDIDALFEWLIREVTILRHPASRNHKNLLSLEGVCWDYYTSDISLRPVLIFQRAQHGNLLQYVAKQGYQNMTLSHRLELATDVMSALGALHAANIIHGDIKPQNILIFEDKDGSIFARVCDFGYSSLVMEQDGSVVLPLSKPWNSPEVGRRGIRWTIPEAKGADIYSLGLLCLWILFNDKISIVSGLEGDNIFFSDDGIAIIQDWKVQHRMKEIACRVLDMDANLSENERLTLRGFFESSFSKDTAERYVDLRFCSSTLREARHMDISYEEVGFQMTEMRSIPSILETSRTHFQIKPQFLQFLSSHYRLRTNIVSCLHDRATTAKDPLSKSNAAFQLAICYSIGFGCRKNDAEALKWLEMSSTTNDDLASSLKYLSEERDLIYHNAEIGTLVRSGTFQSLEYALEYRREESLKEIEEVYKQEISDLTTVFGPCSMAVLSLQMILAKILMDQGRFPDAEILIKTALTGYIEIFGKDHQETLVCMSALAHTLEENDKYDEAKELQNETLDRRNRVLGPNHLDALESVRRLAGLLHTIGDYGNAESLARRDLDGRIVVRGERHPDVYESMATLASILQDMGSYEESVKWNKKALYGAREILGAEHPQTMVSLGNLASVLQEMAQYEEAEKLFREDLEISRRVLGEDHIDTISSLSNLGLLLCDMERYDEAEEITRQALSDSERTQGQNHSGTLQTRDNLALLLEKLDRYEEAEAIWRENLKTRETLFTSGSPHIAVSINNLAENLVHQDRLDEALPLCNKALELRVATLGENHPETLESGVGLANILKQWNRLPEAEVYLRIVLDGRIEMLGHTHPLTLETLNDIVDVLESQGKIEEAKEVADQFIDDFVVPTDGVEFHVG